MFKNYSIEDFFSNIYKNRLINIIFVICIFLGLSAPTVYKTINSKTIVTNKVNYSSYIVYNIKSSSPDLEFVHSSKIGAYSDFYMKLLYNNLNGSFLFEGISENDLYKISSELETSVNVLKNSDKDYWGKKIHVDYIVNNKGTLVSILTPSEAFNRIVEDKFDKLVERYKNVNEGVTVEKLPTIYSLNSGGEIKKESGFSIKNFIIKEIAFIILSIFTVSILNVFRYIFNPTINRYTNFKSYDIDFVYDIDNIDNLKFMLSRKILNWEDTVFIGTNTKLLETIKSNFSGNIFIARNITEIKNFNNVVFVEEYGVTRYYHFEKLLHSIENLDINIIGVISYKL